VNSFRVFYAAIKTLKIEPVTMVPVISD